MSQDDANAKPTSNLPQEGEQALSALRGIWSAQGQTSAALDEACGNTKACKNMDTVGFGGLVESDDTPARAQQSVGKNVRTAWKTRLEREGKAHTQTGSLKDLIFGSSEHNSAEHNE